MLGWFRKLILWLVGLFTGRLAPAAPESSDGHRERRPPRDPYSGVRHPRTQRPSSGSAAAAVAEPDDEDGELVVRGSTLADRMRANLQRDGAVF